MTDLTDDELAEVLPRLRKGERVWFDAFLRLPEAPRERVKVDSIKGSQMLQPLFEFSGACAGCVGVQRKRGGGDGRRGLHGVLCSEGAVY